MKQVVWRVALLKHTVAQHGDSMSQRHRFDLVMSHVNRGHSEALVKPTELCAKRHSELCIEVGQRLVHEEGLRLADHRSTHGNSLALPTREDSGLTIEQGTEAEHTRDILHSFIALGPWGTPESESKSKVLVDRHLGVQGVVLEDHCHIPLARLKVTHVYITYLDCAGRELLESRDHP